ncbi:MAG: F0F1 ATP synthase subunit delta [Desulfarculaceae bacterium]|nr:F0F1 ATP synthase subunit delta [Desulfarculaceae bacterium]
MLLDWFTVAAQVVNFLILVWLLKHFLYDRIIKAIDQREAAIAERFAQAETREEKAAQEEKELARRRLELEEESGAMLAEAKEQAETRRRELVSQAKQEVEGQRNNWREALARDRQALAGDLARLAAQGAAGMARRALTDLAGAEVDRLSLEVFLAKLKALEGQERGELAETLGEAGSLKVRAAFELDDEQRGRIAQALAGLMGREPELEFSQDPELILGLEIRLPGRKLAWSLDEYLSEMEQSLVERLAQALNSGAQREAEAAPAQEEASDA